MNSNRIPAHAHRIENETCTKCGYTWEQITGAAPVKEAPKGLQPNLELIKAEQKARRYDRYHSTGR